MLVVTGGVFSASVSGAGVSKTEKKPVESLRPGVRDYYRSGRYRRRRYSRVFVGGGMRGGK